jgi:hypothetical protein
MTAVTKPDAGKLYVSWQSFVLRGSRHVITRGQVVRGDDPACVARPAFFLPHPCADAELAEARQAFEETNKDRQARLAERYRERARARLAELDAEAPKPRRRLMAGRDRLAEAREDADAVRAMAAAKAAALAVRREREALARRLGAS